MPNKSISNIRRTSLRRLLLVAVAAPFVVAVVAFCAVMGALEGAKESAHAIRGAWRGKSQHHSSKRTGFALRVTTPERTDSGGR